MKLKSIVGYKLTDLLNTDEIETSNIIMDHIVWFKKNGLTKTIIGTTSKEQFILHITLSEFKKLIEQ
jgi:hypothetical protein